MPSRPFPPTSSPNFFTKNRILLLALTISASLIIFCSILYLLYHLLHSLKHRLKTNPFNESSPLKLQRFSYKELKQATNGFHTQNVIGKGGSSTVFKGTLKDGKFIAIKSLDSLCLQREKEFQNELEILGGLRSPFLVTLLGYCVEKKRRLLVFDYMPKRSLQEFLFGDDDDEDGSLSLMSWEKRFLVIMDVARALEFLHLGCDPPVIHGDIKPSNVLLDDEYRGKISDFGLSRIKVEEEGEFSEELWKSQEFSVAESEAIGTPIVESVNEVDFSLALQASSSSSKNSRPNFNVRVLTLNSLSNNASIASENEIRSGNSKGKEISSLDVDRDDEFSSIDHSKELNVNASSIDEKEKENGKQWGKDWWWRQDESGELCSKDYVMEWLGSQICSSNPDWDEEKKNTHKRTELENSSPTDRPDDAEEIKESKEKEKTSPLGFDPWRDRNRVSSDERVAPNDRLCSTRGISHQACSNEYPSPRPKKEKKNLKKRPRKIQDWWKEENLVELRKKTCKLKNLQTEWKKGFYLCKSRSFGRESQNNECDPNEGFSFRKKWRKTRRSPSSIVSEMYSGDNLSNTTSMRGTLCYVAPEYGGECEFLMEKADIYSFGVLILVIVSGRRPLHVLASPMKMEKANLISWCRNLAQSGNILELVDEKLKENYNKGQASLCINMALSCIQKIPELRPDIGDIVKILKGDMDLPSLPFEFSPSPPSKVYSRSRRKHKVSAE